MHEYTWKMGFEYSSNTTLTTNKPLTENTVIIDLYDGHRYRVQAIKPDEYCLPLGDVVFFPAAA